jgi:DNA processing protein
LTDEEEQIFTCLRKVPDGIQVNQLAMEVNFPFSKLSALLLQMEFKSILRCLPGGIYKALIPV